MLRRVFSVCAVAVGLALPTAADAQAQRPQTGSLRIVVKDPSGGVIPGAMVQVKGAEDRTAAVVKNDRPSDGQGVATVEDLVPGRYALAVSFPGFETLVLPDLRVRARDNRRDAVLKIQKLDENVSVGRDKATVASDPDNDRFNTVLSKDQINALPDDPDEMERVLKEMAGPGAMIRVDGFRGGKLPPKSQIRSIRFSRDAFAAENHMAGMVFVDIVTQPGMGPIAGSMDFLFRDDSLNARNAFQAEKGAEQTQQYTVNFSGALRKERTSFSLSVSGATLFDSANLFAQTADGMRTDSIRRPSDKINFNGRIDHALNTSHTLRANLQQNANENHNLGVGGYELDDRAYTRTTDDLTLRLSEGGPWARNLFGENRLQVRRQSSESLSDVEAKTIRVLDTFTDGGAQQAGGRKSTDIEWATNVDWSRGKHAVRFGTLVEGGWYRSDNRTNYLGTYTFANSTDYDAGRPETYTQRLGNPLVEYSHWQAGVFVQDDWRVRSNLTLSAGLRQELQTHVDDALNLAPRVGFTWSPFKSGRTTIRGGGGLFYDWLDPDVYEQTLRVDGTRQTDVVISNPRYPDPFAPGVEQQVLASGKYMLAGDLVSPIRQMGMIGLSQQFTPTFGANLSYNRSRGYDRFRGRNINAPLNGVRPDPTLGNVTQVESTANMRGQTFSAGVNYSIPARRMFLFANYARLKQENDADGAFGVPANSYRPDAEWGPVAGVARHNVSGMLTSSLTKALKLNLGGTWRSGTPYNITTGRDDNGDGVFNDRPAGVGRNAALTAATWDVNARLSYAFGFGQKQATAGGPGGPMVIMHRVGGPVGGGGDISSGFGGGAEDKRIRFELFASASNLFNHTNLVNYSGVVTSPFFRTATAAMPARRIDIGVRMGF